MTYLDISTSVNSEDYQRVLNSLLDQFEDWRIDRGSCTDFYLFVGQITRTFRWDRDARGMLKDGAHGAMRLDLDRCPTDEARAEDLREVRGRILRFTVTQPSEIYLDLANQFLRNSGLTPWTPEAQPPEPPKYRVETYSVVTNGTLSAEEIREKLTRYLRRLGVAGDDVSVYVTPQAPARRRDAAVPRSETTPLIESRALTSAGYRGEL